MADERFDLTYEGLIARGADREKARKRLAAVFNLTDKGVERLFSGKPVVVKRDVNAATAAQFKKIFAQAGAVLTIAALAGAESADNGAGSMKSGVKQGTSAGDAAPVPLTLASGVGALEDPPTIVGPELDISYLSLVPGDDWTLEDCQPPPMPVPELDLSYLTLEPMEDSEDLDTQPGDLYR